MSTLYRKYRPQQWSDVAGQEQVKAVLRYQLEHGTTVHAYLFAGPRGVGKTTVARIFSRALNCTTRGASSEPCGTCASCTAALAGETLDIIEMDAASHRGIDAVREDIIEHSRFAPAKSKYKVYIIDEAHMLTTEAFNAFLKTLEEPPAHAVFILATTDSHKMPETILSRCQRHDFLRIPEAAMVARLKELVTKEGGTADDVALAALARRSEGGLRDAEGFVGKALAVAGDGVITLAMLDAVLPSADSAQVRAYVEAILRREAGAAFAAVRTACEAGADAERFAIEAIEALRAELHEAVAAGALGVGRQQAAMTAIETIVAKQKLLRGVEPAQLVLEVAAVALCTGGQSQTARPGATGTKKAEPVAAATTAKPEVVEEAKAAASPAKVVSEAVIREKWQSVMARLGENNPSLTFVLGIADFLGVEGATVRLGFKFSFHREKMLEPKAIAALQEAIATETGAVVQVECLLLERNEAAEEAAAMSVGSQAHPVPALTADPLVAAFGGRVVE